MIEFKAEEDRVLSSTTVLMMVAVKMTVLIVASLALTAYILPRLPASVIPEAISQLPEDLPENVTNPEKSQVPREETQEGEVVIVTLTATPVPSVTVYLSPTPTSTGTLLPTNTPTITPTVTASPTQTFTPTFTPTNTSTPTPTYTPTNTHTPTATQIPLIYSPIDNVSIQELTDILTDGYHPPAGNLDDRHHGVDFAFYRRGDLESIEGVLVRAILPGFVVGRTANRYPFGNSVIIETLYEDLPPGLADRLGMEPGESLYHMYGHMQNPPPVQMGEIISLGEVIGAVGKSGNAAEPHLHLETRIGPLGGIFNAMAYYIADRTEAEAQSYILWRTSGMYQHFDPMILFSEYDYINGE